MKTTDCTGRPDHPEELLQRFDGRLALLDQVAEYALTVEDINERTDVYCEAPLRPEIAQGIRELYSDFREMRQAIDAFVLDLLDRAYPERKEPA